MFETEFPTINPPVHNMSPYTVTAQFAYRRGMIQPWQIGNPPPIQVHFNNLTVAVVEDAAHPPYLLWDPSDPDGSQGRTKREVAFQLDDQLGDTAEGTFRVYRVPRPEGQAPIREEEVPGFSIGLPYIWQWDGRQGESGWPIDGSWGVCF